MEQINLILVFFEGLFSFFSPCVLPIIPIYLSMLSNSSTDIMKDKTFKNSTLFKNTLFFTLGICTTFFILSMAIGAFSQFFIGNKELLMLIGGIFIIIMGVFYMGYVNIPLLQREKRFEMHSKDMNILSSFMLGLTFSFGWTPCIGPMLTSVLIMASGTQNILIGNALVLIYSIGFILPFIILAMFYKKLFEKFNNMKKHLGTLKKIGGILLIISGLIMSFNGINKINESRKDNYKAEVENKTENNKVKALDFTLYDQYGKEHKLSDYKGKTVFLNIWATWCPPCKAEMPHIEELYNEYNKNNEDVIILGVSTPNLGNEGDEKHISKFLKDNEYTFPVVFDNNADLIYGYSIQSFPSTFIIDKEGYVREYVPGAMDKETMKSLIESNK
ncbi:MAG: cytochrome c biogenesis protein/redoxin [Terrisporobacter othiniensis]|uniref:cytochrome c biogenesis protein/redoxin n=1 Tax=Terrisporobacter petrolearius TaxID=1460447 RepID=UPI0008EAFC24|nr:cytochrome c biogenesis protein/redoxin [Terrisporobacter petrolearius]MDU4862409.1 cytochrome c biogenesis protein/redoxin [Terrisporobacter othiniensis]MDU6993699.1 cytochrome c biogenesis protein/redoxin [Terrisporobacter othiniensis]SFJ16807.1 cytochrome c-type biogenesis protein [Terrisporobacter glycolicus]